MTDRKWYWIVGIGGIVFVGLLWLRRRHQQGFGFVEEEHPSLQKIVGNSTAIKNLKERIKRFAAVDGPVLIEGETGTGKELVADAIIALSNRRDKPSVKVNMAAIPESLLMSELFGHVKGAFSGAVSARSGLFKEFDGGTLVLDEIGEAPKQLQAALLRAVEQGEIKPVGAEQTQKVNVRIIASTNRSLANEVNYGNFREDLYQRLQALNIKVPPLRERMDDVRPLALAFAKKMAHDQGKKLKWSEAGIAKLQNYNWRRGNVRELRNVIEQAIAFTDSGQNLDDNVVIPTPKALPQTLEERVAECEREVLREALAAGSYEEAAQRLGISVPTLWRKRKQHNLEGVAQCFTRHCDL